MKKIRYYILIVIGIFAFGLLMGQDNPQDLWLNADTDDFATIQQNVENYYIDKDQSRGSGYKQWKRWEYIQQHRLTEDGRVFNYTAKNFQEYHNYIDNASTRDIDAGNGYWTSLGPTGYVDGNGWNGGMGRVNCITFHPTNAATLWVGCPSGGLWKSTNYGTNWTPLTDGMPRIGVSSMVVDYTNTNIMYLLTGDGDGGDVHSIGVLKTTDGGVTWLSTGLSYTVTQYKRMYKLIMHPTVHTTLFAVGTDGILKSANSGATWTNVLSVGEKVYDIEFRPANPGTMYACTNSEFYKSTNTGSSWTQVTSGVPTGATRMAIGVSANSTTYVYLFTGPSTGTGFFKGFYRSNTSGSSFVFRADEPNILGYAADGMDNSHQSWYDLAVVVNKDSYAQIVAGGINVWKSTSYGQEGTWVNKSVWNNPPGTAYTHADIHALEQNPLNGYLYCGSDGGIFVSYNFGNTWYDKTAGLAITQNYRIAGYESNINLIINGTQDNGSNKWTGGSTMLHTLGADGMDCMIDHGNSNILYNSTQNGDLRKSTNGGASYYYIQPSGSIGSWVTPYAMHATNSSIIYGGYTDIYKSTNGGSSWSNLGYRGTGAMALGGPSNPNRVYAAYGSTLYMSNNGGSSFTTVSGNLPSYTITFIAVNPNNSFQVWVTFDGYVSGQKVYQSLDAGTTWTNVSGSLPNIPVNCIAYENTGGSPDDALYIGTDVGVYYKDNDLGDWIPYMNGMPATMVFDLEINETSNKITAGTYGRGFWRSDTYTGCHGAFGLNPSNDPSNPNSTGFQHYETYSYILSSRIITGGVGTDVTYDAATYIKLTTGFHARKDNLFVAKLGGCSSSPEPPPEPFMPLTGVYVGSQIYAETEDYNGDIVEQDWGILGEDELTDDNLPLSVNIYPNPFSSTITIEYELKQAEKVEIFIFNHLGKQIEKNVQDNNQTGLQQFIWNSYGLPNGVYFVHVLSEQKMTTNKIVKMR